VRGDQELGWVVALQRGNRLTRGASHGFAPPPPVWFAVVRLDRGGRRFYRLDELEEVPAHGPHDLAPELL
jgi:hypothetical protein